MAARKPRTREAKAHMTSQNTARVQKHRAKFRGEHCRRLEVCIGITVIENVREIAKRKKVPMWQAVQDALEAYVTGHAEVVNANHVT